MEFKFSLSVDVTSPEGGDHLGEGTVSFYHFSEAFFPSEFVKDLMLFI